MNSFLQSFFDGLEDEDNENRAHVISNSYFIPDLD
jgi:hypothetical protein